MYKNPDGDPMDDGRFVKRIKATCKTRRFESHTWIHFGRKIAPTMMDLEEVSELDKMSLDNCANDVFGEFYSSKLFR